jgi:TonB family protein
MKPLKLALGLTKFPGTIVLACMLLLMATARADRPKDRKAYAQELTKDIAQSGVRRIYFPDLMDASERQVVSGRYFAANFSRLVNEKAKNAFVVVSRIEVHKYLAKSGLTDHDLSTDAIRAKLASDFGLDAILSGTITVNQGVASIDLIGRDPSGKELFRSRYEEVLNPSLIDDMDVWQSGGDFYFPGLDGVTVPKCLSCPIPERPLGDRAKRLEGKVILSILVTVEGKAGEIHLVKKFDPDFDRAAINAVQTWRFVPSHDPDGKPVPVRVPVELTFRTG